ncbi:hypothetical protein [Kribbella pittospori]|nr:hypothetical protein [Kribbella pittospori]
MLVETSKANMELGDLVELVFQLHTGACGGENLQNVFAWDESRHRHWTII